jgi:hypothetical protein
LTNAVGDHAIEKITADHDTVPSLGEDWFDPLEAGVRQRIRSFIEAMLESELDAALNRGRYKRAKPPRGHRHGMRFETRRQAKDEVVDGLTFSSRKRMHSTLGYTSPMAFEENWHRRQETLAA